MVLINTSDSSIASVEAEILSFLHKRSCCALSFSENTLHAPQGFAVYAQNHPAQSLKLVAPDISLPQFHTREQILNNFF